MALVNSQIKQAKPRDTDYKMADGEGMCLLVKRNGSKYWRMDYRFRGKRKTLAIGVYLYRNFKGCSRETPFSQNPTQ